MPYHIEKKGKNGEGVPPYKWFVYDNENAQLPSHGFKTKKEARKQQIAVALSQSQDRRASPLKRQKTQGKRSDARFMNL